MTSVSGCIHNGHGGRSSSTHIADADFAFFVDGAERFPRKKFGIDLFVFFDDQFHGIFTGLLGSSSFFHPHDHVKRGAGLDHVFTPACGRCGSDLEPGPNDGRVSHTAGNLVAESAGCGDSYYISVFIDGQDIGGSCGVFDVFFI